MSTSFLTMNDTHHFQLNLMALFSIQFDFCILINYFKSNKIFIHFLRAS